MSDAVASSVAAPGWQESFNNINFTAHNAIDGKQRTYFKSKVMNESSGSRASGSGSISPDSGRRKGQDRRSAESTSGQSG